MLKSFCMLQQSCIFIRGKPGAGKTTLAKMISRELDIDFLDSGLINKTSHEYKTFCPVNTKNPSKQVKKYSFIFHKAESSIKNNRTVLWCQPWSRMSEIMVTLQNFAYYFSNTGIKTWHMSPIELINSIPFPIGVIELVIDSKESLDRIKKRQKTDKVELARFDRFNIMYQTLSFPLQQLKIDAKQPLENSVKKSIIFITKLQKTRPEPGAIETRGAPKI